MDAGCTLPLTYKESLRWSTAIPLGLSSDCWGPNKREEAEEEEAVGSEEVGAKEEDGQ
jgi:hypothetical protein